MGRPKGTFRMEAAGSLTPELLGYPKSQSHDRTALRDRKTASKAKDGAEHERH